MKKVILEEIENMKYLLGYKRGVVISEQEEKNDLIDKYSTKSISNSIDSGDYSNLDPRVADAIKQSQNMVGGQSILPNSTSGATSGTTSGTTSGATTPAPSTPSTPIKIGVKYPSIMELQNSLNTKFQSGLTPDGMYGPKTSSSILAALTKTSTTTTANTTPVNTVVGGDASSEAIKKTAEANASTGVVANAPKTASNSNFTEVDGGDFT
jgi:hypothetical protein